MASTGDSMLAGVAWVGSARMIVRVLGLVSTVVLARLLAPEDFGLVAIAMGVIGLLEAFTEMGFNQALIRYRDTTAADYATAWTLNAVRGVVLCLLVLASAYPLATALGDERLFGLLAVIALLPLVRGLENTRFVDFEKSLQFERVFRLMVVTKVVGVLCTVSLAITWRSYWVLVVGMLVTTASRTLLTFYLAPPGAGISVSAWRRLFRFSGWLSAAEALSALSSRLDPVILAAFVPAQLVGVYHVAREIGHNTVNEVAAPLRRVLFPALSHSGVGSAAFVNAYRSSVAGVFLVLSPLSLGLGLTAPHSVPLVLGAQWEAVIAPLRWFAVALTLSIIGRMAQSVVLASGETRLLFQRNLIMLPVKLGLLIIGARYYGLPGAVAASCTSMLLVSVLNVGLASRISGVGFLAHLVLVRRNAFALLLMTIAVLSVPAVPAGAAGENAALAWQLGLQVAFGGLTYVGVSLLLWLAAGRPQGPEVTLLAGAARMLGGSRGWPAWGRWVERCLLHGSRYR